MDSTLANAKRSAPFGSVAFRVQTVLIPNPGLRADNAVDALAKAPQAAVLAASMTSAAGTESSGRVPAPCFAAWRG